MAATPALKTLPHICAASRSAGISSQEWSVRSGVSEATISRLFSGQNQSPQFCTVAQLVRSVGGSLDELADIPHAPSAPPCDKALAHMIAMDKQREETVLYLQNQVTELRANAERQHRLLIICTAVLGLFLFLFGALLAWDLSDPRYGFLLPFDFRHAAWQPPALPARIVSTCMNVHPPAPMQALCAI